jgi:hypothetical protein
MRSRSGRVDEAKMAKWTNAPSDRLAISFSTLSTCAPARPRQISGITLWLIVVSGMFALRPRFGGGVPYRLPA